VAIASEADCTAVITRVTGRFEEPTTSQHESDAHSLIGFIPMRHAKLTLKDTLIRRAPRTDQHGFHQHTMVISLMYEVCYVQHDYDCCAIQSYLSCLDDEEVGRLFLIMGCMRFIHVERGSWVRPEYPKSSSLEGPPVLSGSLPSLALCSKISARPRTNKEDISSPEVDGEPRSTSTFTEGDTALCTGCIHGKAKRIC